MLTVIRGFAYGVGYGAIGGGVVGVIVAVVMAGQQATGGLGLVVYGLVLGAMAGLFSGLLMGILVGVVFRLLLGPPEVPRRPEQIPVVRRVGAVIGSLPLLAIPLANEWWPIPIVVSVIAVTAIAGKASKIAGIGAASFLHSAPKVGNRAGHAVPNR